MVTSSVPKIDYYDDPDAPTANSLVVAVAAVVTDDAGRVLMIERSDNHLWALPGGAQEIGESVTDAAKREVFEETGVHIEITDLVGVYSDPRHVIAYDNGEVRQEFSVCLRARPISGEPRTSDETRTVQWVHPAELDALAIHRSNRLRIRHALASDASPHVD